MPYGRYPKKSRIQAFSKTDASGPIIGCDGIDLEYTLMASCIRVLSNLANTLDNTHPEYFETPPLSIGPRVPACTKTQPPFAWGADAVDRVN
jgi:hypothetical protein